MNSKITKMQQAKKVIKTIVFWILSCTWGFPLTFMGAIIALGLIIAGFKPKRFHCFIYFEIGEGWGGFECGAFFFVNKNASLSIKQHESGHAIQNIIFGWFMIIIVSIPSSIRYWYRRYLIKYKGRSVYDLKPYDSMWFEGWASKLGRKYFK